MKDDHQDTELLLAYLRSELSLEDTRKLEARLKEDPTLREKLLELSTEEAALTDWAQSERALIELDNRTFEDTEVPATSESGVDWMPWLAAAAAVFLGIAAFAALFRTSNSSVPQNVARIVASVDADWLTSAPADSEGLSTGHYELAKGTIDLLFTDGARVIMSGPTRFQLVSNRHIHLESGNLVARIPDEALGFIVTSPQSEVIDLGTEFGLSVDGAGRTDVHVMDGLVEVLPRSSGADSSGVMIAQGEALRFRDQPESIPDDIPVSTREDLVGDQFYGSLGVQTLRGSVRITSGLSPDDFTKPRAGRNRIDLIAEQQGVTLPEPLAVTLNAPGSYRNFGKITQSLPEGTRVNSYLLHFRPSSQGPVRGVIRFEHPIVGVLCTPHHLDNSDSVFGIPSIHYPEKVSTRGLEPGAYFDEWVAKSGAPPNFVPDEVILSQDRFAISINVTANTESGYFDQVRVLTLAPDRD